MTAFWSKWAKARWAVRIRRCRPLVIRQESMLIYHVNNITQQEARFGGLLKRNVK